jgi:hypothetical protein
MRRSILSNRRGVTRLAILVVIGSIGASARSEEIVIRSGNGPIGGADEGVHMLVAPSEGGFGRAFTPDDFQAARTGPNAFIPSVPPNYLQTLAGDSIADWISTAPDTGAGGSALFAIDFTVATSFRISTLDLHFSVDNFLGDPCDDTSCTGGLFINGQPVPGLIPSQGDGHNFEVERAIIGRDISQLLVPGTNTLYLYDRDIGFNAGLLFRAEIETTAPICADGTVSAGAGPIADVLFINGSSGDASRTVTVAIGSPMTASLAASPAGPPSARYVLWIWAAPPTRQVDLDLGSSVLGCVVNPTPFQPFLSPQPFRVVAAGLPPVFSAGVTPLHSPPAAPWALTQARGFARARTMTLQGLIEDVGSASPDRFSVTNAVEVGIE